ncbi:MAG TPA: DUF2442 domain-containing protein, partial [Thermoanaerobaculia bacterium]|nr:DUF2442 domain-containing protein [Thermoanaerobaculia bacterium]
DSPRRLRFRLLVRCSGRINDGVEGEVDLRPLLESDRCDGTLFEPLRDPETFSRVSLSFGAPVWPNGADLAPDALYDAIGATGVWRVPAQEV